jgi:tetratricopeptide (TPR) repeat protein
MIERALRVGAVLAVLLAGAGIAASPERPEAEPEPAGLTLWDDPAFRKQVIGSYGIHSELEPGMDPDEQERLEKILPLLASDPDAALRELTKAVKPESSALLDFNLGTLHFQQEHLDEAAAHYENALAKFPSFLRAHKNLGLIRVRQGRFEEAIAPLSRVIQLGGGDGTTYGLLGYSYASTGQYVSAESAYRNALLLQADLLDWKLGLTQAVYRQQKYEETIALCNELIVRYPDRADFWLLQANAFIGLERPAAAAQNFELLDRMGKATPLNLYTLGDIYVNQGLWDLAARAYRRATELNPEQGVHASLQRVEHLAQRGALEQAAALLDRFEELWSGRLAEDERKRLLKLRARVAVAGGSGGDAVGVLEEIVALDPLDGDALLMLGQHYARLDEPERAIFYYERAESLDDFEADARVRHAQVLVGLSRFGEAVPLLRRAQELKHSDDVARYLEQVERAARTSR